MTDSVPLLFKGLTDAQRQQLTALAHLRQFRPKAVIYRQDQASRHLYLIKSGCVAFGVRIGARRAITYLFKPGDAFGVTSLVCGSFPNLGSTFPITPTEAWVWEARVVCAHELYAKIARNAVTIAFDYVNEYRRRHAALLTQTTEQRLARAFVKAAHAVDNQADGDVDLPLTNSDFAQMADTDMYTVSRTLKKWERQGILVKSRGRVRVRDLAALKVVGTAGLDSM